MRFFSPTLFRYIARRYLVWLFGVLALLVAIIVLAESIELLRRAAGRVFQTDTDLSKMEMPATGTKADWDDFQSRTKGDTLFFDYQILP